MRTIIPLLCCCISYCYCFSQTEIDKDSLKSLPGTLSKLKQHLPENIQPAISIYPNPAKNKITIQVKNFDPGMVSVKVLDTKGKLVREDIRLLTNGTEEIVMFLMLKAGIYIIIISEPGKIARKKIVML